jgi:hypothetical protein
MTNQQIRSATYLIVVLITVILILLIAWNKKIVSNEEEKIYWSIVNDVFPEKNYPDDFAFMSMATLCDSPEFIGNIVPSDVQDAFKEANGPSGKPIRLSYFEGIVPVVDWESTSEVHSINKSRSVPETINIAAVSRIGFNKERNKALVCIENVRPHLHSKSFYIYLEKNHDNWKIVDG